MTATRQLAEAWEHEVRRQVTLQGQAVGRASVRERLDGSVGRPTLVSLRHVLARSDAWREDGDGYRYDVDGGYARYDPATQELEIVAEVSEAVRAAGTASRTVQGRLDETVEAEGIGRYYDDEWGGMTERRARQAAERAAADGLAEAAERRLGEARSQAEHALGGEVDQQAARNAQQALADAEARRSAQLARSAATGLEAVGVAARGAFHGALALAYRDAILAYARSRQAQGLRCTETDGVLDIEFELDA